MKILLACVHFHSSFGWSIDQALRRANHEVRVFDYRWPRSTRVPGASIWRRHVMPKDLLREAREFRPDLLFIAKGDAIPPETIQAVRSEVGCRAVNWFPDARMGAYDNVMGSLPFLNLCFTKNKRDLARFKLLGLDCGRFLMHCADRELHIEAAGPPRMEKYRAEVGFVGSFYPYRDAILSALTDFDLKVWGPGWKRSELYRKRPEAVINRDARSLEQAWVFQTASVSPNVHHYDDDDGLNQRTFDIAGSGGCQLVDAGHDVESVFEVGDEVAAYCSLTEMIETTRWLIDHPAEAKRMGERCKQKMASGHTYDHRIQEALSCLED